MVKLCSGVCSGTRSQQAVVLMPAAMCLCSHGNRHPVSEQKHGADSEIENSSELAVAEPTEPVLYALKLLSHTSE